MLSPILEDRASMRTALNNLGDFNDSYWVMPICETTLGKMLLAILELDFPSRRT
jgi:hypothetical protein